MINQLFLWIGRYWLPISALTLCAITFLSLWPLPDLPDVPGTDKTHHLIAYAALAFPVTLRRPTFWPWCLLFFVLWSGAIEVIQPYVNRYGEWLDFAANTAGTVLGALAAFTISRLAATAGRKAP